MGKYKVFEYDTLRIGHIDTNWDGSIRIEKNNVACQYINFGMAVTSIEQDDYSRPDIVIRGRCKSHYSVSAGDKLYFSERCRMRRDLFRNTGYKIVLDKDKADVTVIPEPPAPERMTYDVLTWQEEKKILTLYTVDEVIKYNTEEMKQSFFNRIKATLETLTTDGDIQLYQDTILRNCNCWILRKHPCYTEILTDGSGNGYRTMPYIYETDVELNYPIEISPETLFLWSKMSINSQEFRDAVCASDWKKYPATLLVFLKTEGGRYGLDCSGASQMFRLVLNTIGYEQKEKTRTLLRNKNISAEDWNMLQRYILYHFNMDEKGGAITDWKALAENRKEVEYLTFLRSAIVAKPLMLASDQNFNNICNILV